MKLFISGTKEFDPNPLQKQSLKVKIFLDGSKDGELFTTEQLAEKTKVAANSMARAGKRLPAYTHRSGSKRYWGKPSTIKQLIKETR